ETTAGIPRVGRVVARLGDSTGGVVESRLLLLNFRPSYKWYCPFCVSVKKLLDQLGANYKTVELDLEGDGSEIQAALAFLAWDELWRVLGTRPTAWWSLDSSYSTSGQARDEAIGNYSSGGRLVVHSCNGWLLPVARNNVAVTINSRQFDEKGKLLQNVSTRLAVSTYGEDDLMSLIQT
ncbi:hypothetical protein Tsubulata_038664, partial [Turnera subulata]